MATSNKQFNLPVTGSTPGGPGGWGDQLDVNFNNIDSCLGNTLSLTLSATDIVLTKGTVTTPGQVSNLRLALTGNLLQNVNIIFPSGTSGVWLISNAVTGNYFVTLKTAATGSTVILQNRFGFFTVYSDGTNMFMVDNSTPPGMIQAFGGSAAPFGWLLCDGTSYSTANYPYLFASIGYTWGGSGGSFNVPNLQGMFLRGSGTNSTYPTAIGPNVGSYQADKLLSHTHTITDSGHSHIIGSSYPSVGTGANALSTTGGAGTTPTTFNAFTNISINQTGSSDSNPKNYGVLYCIKT